MDWEAAVYPMMLVVLASLGISSPLWVLMVFAAYAIGRRRFTTRGLLLLVTLEAICVGLSIFIVNLVSVKKE